VCIKGHTSIRRKSCVTCNLLDVVEISSSDEDEDSDLIMMPSDQEEEEEDEEEEGEEDPQNSGSHTNDAMNQRDAMGGVLVNVGHPATEPGIYLAPQLAAVVKPHQVSVLAPQLAAVVKPHQVNVRVVI